MKMKKIIRSFIPRNKIYFDEGDMPDIEGGATIFFIIGIIILLLILFFA